MLLAKSTPTRVPRAPYLAVFFGVLAVSTAAIFIRFAQEEVPSLVIAAFRLSLATMVLSPLALGRWRRELLALGRRELLLALISGGFLALHFASWITSLEMTSVASSVVLVTTTPLWTAIFSPLFLKETMPPRAAMGMIIALFGGAIVGISDSCTLIDYSLICPSGLEFFQGRAFLGNLLALVGAWMAAGYLIVGRRVRKKLPLIPYVFIVYGIASCFLMGMVILSGEKLLGYSPQSYLWLAALALIPQLLGHSIFNWALAFLPASYVAVTLLGEPIGSTLLAFYLLSETPGGGKLFGAILILTGIVLATQLSVKQA